MNERVKTIYDSLLTQFNGANLIGTKDLAIVLGVHPETVNRRRREARGVPPMASVGRGAKIQYDLYSVANYIAEGLE